MEREVRYCTTGDGVRIAYATTGSGYPLVRGRGSMSHLEHVWTHRRSSSRLKTFVRRFHESFKIGVGASSIPVGRSAKPVARAGNRCFLGHEPARRSEARGR